MTFRKDLLTLLPSIGISIFIGLYVYSASLYPGGSQSDLNSVGFDWGGNYWCNLMSEKSLNGLENPSRPVSIFAMVILCSSMVLFFFHFSKFFVKSKIWKMIIKVAGTLAMSSAVFIFTSYHDIMTSILSIGGIMAIIGIIRTLYINRMRFFMVSGIVSMILVGMNNLFYYIEMFIEFLPITQILSFILILAWTVGLNFKMTNKNLPRQLA